MKVYIESLGCDSNLADTSRIRKYFAANMAKLVQDYRKADLIILMSCGFNKIMMDKNIRRLKTFIRKSDARILLGGCIPKINKKINSLVDESFGPKELDKLDTLFNFRTKISGISPEFSRNDKKIIRIATGCEGNCSYCAIKVANTCTRSRKFEDIENDIKEGLKEGYSKFIFVSEDNGSWGQDIESNLAELMRNIIKIRGNFKITLTTINPRWFIRYPGLTDLFKSGKVEKKLYLPLQSGSDRILGLMKRSYTVREYVDIFSRLKREIPEIKIQTDVLAGFPTEKNEDFLATLKLIKELDIYFLQVFAYTEMEGTASSKISQKVPFKTAEKRAKKLIRTFLDKNKDICSGRKLVVTNLESIGT